MKKVTNEASKKVLKPRFYLMPIVWIVALYYKIIARVKLKKVNFKCKYLLDIT